MDITYDPAKNERNIRERGISFDRAADFDIETAIFWVDTRRDYREVRQLGLGYLDYRLHVMCFTEVAGGIRVISLRRANSREAKRYEKAKALDR